MAPWGPTECAGELHDTFSVQTQTFGAAREGIFEGGFGGTRLNNYQFYSFPNDAVGFLYHIGLFKANDLSNELVNINSAALQGTTYPGVYGATCHSSNPNGYCMNFGFVGACADTLFWEVMTVGPATGNVETDAYWASSTYGRWFNVFNNAIHGYALAEMGHNVWLSNYAPPHPAGVSYAARRLKELVDGESTQEELHQFRLNAVSRDPWLQSLAHLFIDYEGHYTNTTILDAMEIAERSGKPIADKFMHANIDQNRRRTQIVWNYSPPPPPPLPPSPPPPAHPPYELHGMPLTVYRPTYSVVESAYKDVEFALASVLDEHIANRVINSTVHEVAGSPPTYRVILDFDDAAIANATARGISTMFVNHLAARSGLELALADEPVRRGWRTLCNDSAAPPPPPQASWELRPNCSASSALVTSGAECAEAAAFVGRSYLELGNGAGCQSIGDNYVLWGGAVTATGFADCGLQKCMFDNGNGAECANVFCACRVVGPFDPSYVIV